MVGDYIKTLRSSSGLSQRQLAHQIGVSPSMLSLVEGGRRDPTIRLLKDIARVLEIPAVVLFAAALDDGDTENEPPIIQKFRDMSADLLAAVQHSVILQRIQRARDQR